MFVINCLKDASISTSFCIHSYITFSNSSTRSTTHLKLKHSLAKSNTIGHFYFSRLPRLWNSLPTINLYILWNNDRYTGTRTAPQACNEKNGPPLECTPPPSKYFEKYVIVFFAIPRPIINEKESLGTRLCLSLFAVVYKLVTLILCCY